MKLNSNKKISFQYRKNSRSILALMLAASLVSCGANTKEVFLGEQSAAVLTLLKSTKHIHAKDITYAN